MQFQAYNKILICREPIENIEVDALKLGYSFQIRYPSYRGTFLSCIEALSFSMDGEKIAPEDVRFILEGKEYLLDEVGDQYKAYWYVMTPAHIKVFKDGGLPAGDHQLEVDMLHRIPYAGYEGEYLRLRSVVHETLPVLQEGVRRGE